MTCENDDDDDANEIKVIKLSQNPAGVLREPLVTSRPEFLLLPPPWRVMEGEGPSRGPVVIGFDAFAAGQVTRVIGLVRILQHIADWTCLWI